MVLEFFYEFGRDDNVINSSMSRDYYTVINTVSANSRVLYTYVYTSMVLFPFIIPLYNLHNRVVAINNTNFGTVLCTHTIVVVVVNGCNAIFPFTAVFIFIKTTTLYTCFMSLPPLFERT